MGEPSTAEAGDLFYVGGGQDRDQAAVAVDMAGRSATRLIAAAGRDAVVLAVCGGYQLLGHATRWATRSFPASGSWTCGPSGRRAPA